MRRRVPWALAGANLALIGLFPLAWFAPLLQVRLWRWGAEREITVINGLQALWADEPALALLVTFFAIVAPTVKVLGLALVHFRLLSPRLLGALWWIGRLAMADVFLVAVWIVAFKGLGIGQVTVLWGLWLFTGCILATLVLSLATEAQRRRG
jgi:paraquat-inducible protein A